MGLDTMTTPEFVEFRKIPRLNRPCLATEKIDGTNGVVHVSEDLAIVTAGSRSRWITPEQDNHGFARWVSENTEELRRLGPGYHFGEWWGSGIQRGYGLPKGEKRFSLFNVTRWDDPTIRPACCHVVPTLALGGVDIRDVVERALEKLRIHGSYAASGFMKPEGVVVHHSASNHLYKVTLIGDEAPKALAAK